MHSEVSHTMRSCTLPGPPWLPNLSTARTRTTTMAMLDIINLPALLGRETHSFRRAHIYDKLDLGLAVTVGILGSIVLMLNGFTSPLVCVPASCATSGKKVKAIQGRAQPCIKNKSPISSLHLSDIICKGGVNTPEIKGIKYLFHSIDCMYFALIIVHHMRPCKLQ